MGTVYLIISLICLAAGIVLLALAILPRGGSPMPTAEAGAPSRRGGFRDEPYPSYGAASPVTAGEGVPSGDEETDRLELFSEELNLNLDDFDVVPPAREPDSDGIDAASSKIEFASVFFEDGSSIIDYARETGIIDPTCREYKKIGRVGSGVLTVEKDRLNFQSGRKAYHYDFRKITDLRTGKNFIAARVQGNPLVKLFIIQDNVRHIQGVSEIYRTFLSRAG